MLYCKLWFLCSFLLHSAIEWLVCGQSTSMSLVAVTMIRETEITTSTVVNAIDVRLSYHNVPKSDSKVLLWSHFLGYCAQLSAVTYRVGQKK